MKKNLLNYKGLYGDNNQRDFGDFLHYELLATRSKLYDWEINEHLHTDLFQIFIISTGEGVLIQDHTIGFRASALFTQWRAILSPHFQTPPVAEHFQILNKI